MEEPIQFSVGQTAQRRTCSIMEKPHTELDKCLRMLLSCFIKRMSAQGTRRPSSATSAASRLPTPRASRGTRTGTNCIKIGLPRKLIFSKSSECCSIKSVLRENLTEVLMRTATFHCGSPRELQQMQVLWENSNSC